MAEYLKPLRDRKEILTFARYLRENHPRPERRTTGPFVERMQSVDSSNFELTVPFGASHMTLACIKENPDIAILKRLLIVAPSGKSIDVLAHLGISEDVRIELSLDRTDGPGYSVKSNGSKVLRTDAIDSPETLAVFLHEVGHEAQEDDPLLQRLQEGVYGYASMIPLEEQWRNLVEYLEAHGLAGPVQTLKSRLLKNKWYARMRALRTYIIERDAVRRALESMRDIEDAVGCDIGMNTPVSHADTLYSYIFGHAGTDGREKSFSPREQATLPLRAYCAKSLSLRGVLKEFDENDAVWEVIFRLSSYDR